MGILAGGIYQCRRASDSLTRQRLEIDDEMVSWTGSKANAAKQKHRLNAMGKPIGGCQPGLLEEVICPTAIPSLILRPIWPNGPITILDFVSGEQIVIINREIRHIGRMVLFLAMTVSLGTACDDPSGACTDDSGCERGQLCIDDACALVPCESLRDCPGSGRTCLFDLRACSPKECADSVDGVEITCANARPDVADLQCIEEGGFRGSCVNPVAVQCTNTQECAMLGDGLVCCAGACAAECADEGVIIPVVDAGPPSGDGGQVDGDMPEPEPEAVALCSPCQRDNQCRPLGEEARCTAIGDQGSFCTTPCGAEGMACPEGFFCYEAAGQCVPSNYNCLGCPARPCEGDLVCNLATGACGEPSVLCDQCASDDECADGLTCGNLNGQRFCLSQCADEMCDAGSSCTEGVCTPNSGRCDACGGLCEGGLAGCNTTTGECAECDARVPCPEGRVCQDFTCMEGDVCGCATASDCSNCAGRRACFQGACVECLQDIDCPPRTVCNAQQVCEPSPCAGVACQRGTRCDQNTGLCVNEDGSPGCVDASGCADPDTMACNALTGQCYYTNGTCDPGVGGDGVCAPGGSCTPSPLAMPGGCGCRKVDPLNDPSGPDLAPCQPGGICVHGEFPPNSGMVAPEGFCLHLTP